MLMNSQGYITPSYNDEPSRQSVEVAHSAHDRARRCPALPIGYSDRGGLRRGWRVRAEAGFRQSLLEQIVQVGNLVVDESEFAGQALNF